ncbi:MAG: hypothetical protein HY855_10400 [Burkholderiales bacterium]|nr:hypothetical protein [Burkholderiales bacterium]
MHDAPTPAQIVEAVSGYLRDAALPALSQGERDARVAFHARVAANLLDIAQRELAEDPAVAEAEIEGLRRLLGSDASHDLAAMNRLLCERIADGTLGLHTPGLAEHLWQVTLAKLAVDQPGYSTYRRVVRG